MSLILAAPLCKPAAAADLVPNAIGRHVEIVSDYLDSDEAAEMAAAFDAAVLRWCGYLRCDAQQLESWRVTAYMMTDRQAMAAAGVLPPQLPVFNNGIQRGRHLWLFRQPTAYYTRHLLLHEGVHALYAHLFGATGPGWYQEGMAELLATHRWHRGAIELPVVPDDRDASEYWGRFKVLDQWRQAGKAPSIEAMMQYQHSAADSTAPYAWTWALMSLAGGYPDFRSTSVDMRRDVQLDDAEFNRRFIAALGAQPWSLRWRVLIDEFDYGYDLQRNALRPAETIDSPSGFVVHADVGWQDSGIVVEAGTVVEIEARGRYTIGSEPVPWVCEPQGVTVRYHRGRPLGMVLATVAGDGVRGGVVRPLKIEPVGTGGTFTAAESGRLLLRIGDDPAELADNAGTVAVTVRIGAK